jgi:hypothetical protein
MSPSRYREARTLVRRLCRLPGEDRASFRLKKSRLRRHFERFNVDVSELCQWIMGLRPTPLRNDPATFELWDFFLEPGESLEDAPRDRLREAIFDYVAEIPSAHELAGLPVSESLRKSISQLAQRSNTITARRLFERMGRLQPSHRSVLLKAATEWVVTRYKRSVDNWEWQHAAWEKEKNEWEGQHPELTAVVRTEFTEVFKTLIDPEGSGAPGIRRKNPRICLHKRLSENKDNCVYAGEKGHGPLCWKYSAFVNARKSEYKRFNEKHFAQNAEKYIRLRIAHAPVLALQLLYKQVPQSRTRFEFEWSEYLKVLNINEQTVIIYGRLPHCYRIGDIWENSKCEFNPHTHLCCQYKGAIASMNADTLANEADYREWRKYYLAGPRKPSFRYPSSQHLPIPKIFGSGYHEIDWERSIARLRLDDMPPGEWMEFGFIPWPKGYRPKSNELQTTSVHVNFVGTRARLGFRFDVQHRTSRFHCAQDEVDQLRSRSFPRQAQDQQFLDAARQRLLNSINIDAGEELRILTVDLGEVGAHAAFYRGRQHQLDIPLQIIKLDTLHSKVPESLEKDVSQSPHPKFDRKRDYRGLCKEHVGHHLADLAQGAAMIAKHRRTTDIADVNLRNHDYRSLILHIGWMIRDWVRHNAAQVVNHAEKHQCDLIVFESLRGFSAPGYDKVEPDKKRWLAMFAYGRIRRKVVEKAVERGMRVVTVPYFKSSQFCAACGHEQQEKARLRRNKKKGQFKCECAAAKRTCNCSAEINSDANAARILARVFWDEIRLPQPAR